MSTPYYDLQAQVEARFTALRDEHNAAHQVFEDFEGLQLDEIAPALAGADLVTAAQDEVEAALEAWREACNAARTDLLEPAFEAAGMSFRDHTTRLVDELAPKWNSDALALTDGLREATSMQLQSRATEAAGYQGLQQAARAQLQSFVEAFGALAQSLHAMAQAASLEMKPQYLDAVRAFDDLAESLRNQSLEQEEAAYRQLLSGVEAFSGVAEDVANRYADLANNLAADMTMRVQQNVQAAWEGQVQKLRDSVLNLMADEMAQALVETKASVAISAALTPVMPQLIALYKVLDALEDAIRTWIVLKDKLGL